MKINSPVKVIKWNWKYKLTYILLCVFSVNGFGQVSEKKLVREVEVGKDITLITNVPTSLDIEVHAQNSHRSNTRYGYIVIGKNDKERLFIHKEYAIHTWDKNVVRQEVDVKIESDTKANNEAFLEQLKIELEENNQNQVRVDANVNLAAFKLKSGRFSGEKCQIILEGGTTFSINYLEVKTSLYIPKTANLKVNSILNHTLRLGDLQGDLDLDIEYGEVYGGKINNLNANLRFCYNVIFKEATNVNASATNSHLKIDKVKHLRIGEKKLSKGPSMKGEIQEWLNNNSSMNIYNFREVERMEVLDTANDKFKIGEVDFLDIKSSIFSNYQILKINQTFDLNAKNGDVSIAEVAAGFKKINLKNTHSNLTINVPDNGIFDIHIYGLDAIEYRLPDHAKLIEQLPDESAYFQVGDGDSTGTINIRCDRCELDIWN